MKLTRPVFFLLFLWLSIGQTHAQTVTAFSTDPAKYVNDLQEFMRAVKREETKTTGDAFAANVKGGKFSADQMTVIIQTSNLMLNQKMHAFPQFNDYLEALNAYVSSGMPADFFTGWDAALTQVLQNQKRGSTKDFTAYLDFSKGLFTKNAIYTSNSKTWISSSKDYKLSIENQKPKLTFNTLDLIGITTGDTLTIKATKGVYYPVEQKWEGQGGTVDWQGVGLSPTEVYAQFGAYKLDLTKADVRVDSVTFFHKKLFNEPLQGSYTDKLTPQKTNNNFPLFLSYRKDLKIDDLGPNVKYEGGFALAGATFMGAGDSLGKVSLSFYSDAGKKVVQAWAKNIIIKSKQDISATDAAVSLYQGEDSIYHPGLTLKYKAEKKELSLFTGNEGISATTFYDSYHKQEIKAEQITWRLNEPSIDIKMVASAGKDPVVLTSSNFFQKGDYEKYQGAMDFNPIAAIKTYSDRTQNRDLDAGALAKAMNPNYSEETIKRLLFRLVQDGFIYYDVDRSLVTVKDKVFDYVKANADKQDYDDIKLISYSTQTNAKINLENSDIAITGVPMVVLSDSQDVHIFPGKTDSVLVKKNRDMDFSNIVIAGIVDFVGKGFHFSYDSFKIEMKDLASATINVPTGEHDKDGDAIFKPLKSKIEGLTGYLEIDRPDNKSGKKKYPGYPKFTNSNKSYVYYDKKEIVDSAYLREKFYFELDPFELDSMKTFDPYRSDLKGRLVSGDVFPTFDEPLHIQPDLSLGFKRVTPGDGFDIYKGKGHYNDSIKLSNSGLRGKGQVKYLFTYFKSDSILFALDSLNAVSDTFHMEKSDYQGHTYPLVYSKDNDIHWLPYGDSMYIRQRTSPFVMYEEGSILKGNLLLTANGLKGDGEFEFKEASLASDQFNFQSTSLDADTMSMQIKSIDKKNATFKTPNVKGRVDFAKRFGEFKANEKDIPTEFANNFYKTKINEFTWDMDANILDFKAPEGTDGAEFVSTKAGQDSVRFVGKRGVFNMTTSIIEVTGIKEIRIADALIVPDSGKAVILPGGLLDTLINAVVIADTANKAHRLYNARLAINNRKDYSGSGIYDYTYGTTKETIKFNNIFVVHQGEKKKAVNNTFATTTIDLLDSFKINSGLKFRGTTNLVASKKFLEFDGYGKLDLPSGMGDSTSAWFAFKDELDPNNVIIHYTNPVSDQKDSLFTGIAFSPMDTNSFYSCMMRKLKAPDDIKVFETEGVLKYDQAKKVYTFGDEDRITKGGAVGNILTYDVAKKQAVGEGSFEMGVNYKPIELSTAGKIVNDMDSNKFVFNTFLAMKWPVDKNIMTQFATDVNSFSFNQPSSDYTTAQFENSLGNILDTKKAAKVVEEVKKNGQFVKPKDLSDMNFIVSNAAMLYDPNYQIYRSQGPVSVAFIGEAGVHKQIIGYVEFGLRKGNDFFNIYFESKTDDWYYVSYYNKTLQMVSNKEDFNKMLAAIPAEKRKVKMDKENFFFYTIGTANAKDAFIKRMHMIESGIKVDMDMPTEDQQMENELDSLKRELMKEENGDSTGTAAPAPTKKSKRNKAPVSDDVNPDYQQQPPATTVAPSGPVVPKEIQDYENGKKKKKKKGSTDDENMDETPVPSNKVGEAPAVPKEIQDYEKKGKKKKKGAEENLDEQTPVTPPTKAPETNTPTTPTDTVKAGEPALPNGEDKGSKKKKKKGKDEANNDTEQAPVTPVGEPTPTSVATPTPVVEKTPVVEEVKKVETPPTTIPVTEAKKVETPTPTPPVTEVKKVETPPVVDTVKSVVPSVTEVKKIETPPVTDTVKTVTPPATTDENKPATPAVQETVQPNGTAPKETEEGDKGSKKKKKKKGSDSEETNP